MTGNDTDSLQRSAALFNSRHLVTVVTAIDTTAKNVGFTTRQIASLVDLPDSLVRAVIQRLIAADLLIEEDRLGGVRGPRQLRINPRGPWAQLHNLCSALVPEAPPPH